MKRQKRRRWPTRICLPLLVLGVSWALAGCNPGAGVARELDGACASGDAAACTQLGERVREGRNVLADWGRARDLFEQACDTDDALGCVRLARLHADPRAGRRGVSNDTTRASDLFMRGCDLGAAVGCHDLANLVMSGRRPDPARAAELFERGCEGGETDGCARLGALYEEGRGVEADTSRAVALYERACGGEAGFGCAQLGRAFQLGLGVDADLDTSIALYETACENEMLGCLRLGELYRNGTGLAQDSERALELFIEACNGRIRNREGPPPLGVACFQVGDMLVNGEVDREIYRASYYFRRACGLGHDEACDRS